MSLFVDASVWSLAFRIAPEVRELRHALEGGETIVTTGLILQEVLQGFAGAPARKDIDRFAALPSLRTDRITLTPRNCAIAADVPAYRLERSMP